MYFLLSEERKEQYDFIYIDADHTTAGVLLDAELSWPLLKSGGIMAFDDLTWGADLPPSQSPKAGILLFAERHSKEFDLIVSNTQYWIKKK
jgi:predicted O-methyltransferase YrrM